MINSRHAGTGRKEGLGGWRFCQIPAISRKSWNIQPRSLEKISRSSKSTRQARIETIKAESAEKARIASLDCARALKAYNCSWTSYLAANPSLRAWAKKYPQMVPAEKTRLGAVD